MKGIVFTELLEMMDQKFSLELTDEIIMDADLPSGGAYTSVGTYDYKEILVIVTKLSEKTGIPVADLIEAYGKHLFNRFVVLYPVFFEGVQGTFEFLEQIEGHVHVEVLKLYPDAELPKFDTKQIDDKTLVMEYSSTRPFAPLALGLIIGCINYYQEHIEMEKDDLSGDQNTHVRFTLKKQ